MQEREDNQDAWAIYLELILNTLIILFAPISRQRIVFLLII